MKRIFDFSLAGVGLIFSSWLWALIWLLIAIEDGFPVFIKQLRIGKNGRVFSSYKFRSMVRKSLGEEVKIQAHENDPRVTTVGRVLRKTAFDELPQLLNILCGDMSFVGPRPLLPVEIEVSSAGDQIHVQDINGYEQRISVRPGLTGLAQVYAPRDLPRRFKFKYDILYVKNMSFLLDLKLIFYSFLITFVGKWEKRDLKLGFFRGGTAGANNGKI